MSPGIPVPPTRRYTRYERRWIKRQVLLRGARTLEANISVTGPGSFQGPLKLLFAQISKRLESVALDLSFPKSQKTVELPLI